MSDEPIKSTAKAIDERAFLIKELASVRDALVERDSILAWAFQQNYFSDRMNACIHTSDVRFSPITFRLAEALAETSVFPIAGLDEVLQHLGKYQEDKGR